MPKLTKVTAVEDAKIKRLECFLNVPLQYAICNVAEQKETEQIGFAVVVSGKSQRSAFWSKCRW